MAGLCGWIILDSADAKSRRQSTLCKQKLCSQDGVSVLDIGNGEGWLAVTGAGELSVHETQELLVAISGSPKIQGSSTSQSSDQNRVAEVLAELYLKQGPCFMNAVTGPFALVLIEKSGPQVMLATDRFGLVPLYYSEWRGALLCSTSLEMLVKQKLPSVEIDPQSIFNYLYFHVIPSPSTIYKDVYRLEPAAWLGFGAKGIRIEKYWNASFKGEYQAKSVRELEGEFREILARGVKKELGDESAVGCFLSGGTDSSTITGVLSKLSDSPVRTYSIGFDEERFNEIEYARIVSNHFHAENREYYVTPDDVTELVPELAGIYGEPFGNSSVIPTYYCAKLAESDGINRLLAGDGGDELFGGNERYATQVLFSYYESIPRTLRNYFIQPLVCRFPMGKHILPVRKTQRYIEQALIPMPERLQSYNYMNWFGVRALVEEKFSVSIDTNEPLSVMKKAYEGSNAESIINKMQTLDLKLTLSDNDLPKVVRMCGKAGVSVGFPFLYDELVDFSMRLPANHKVRRLKLRYFFKEALREFLPQEVISKKKHGFGLPFGAWLKRNSRLNQLAMDSLNDLKGRDILRAGFMDELMARKLGEHVHYYGELVWVLMILEQWFQYYEENIVSVRQVANG